MSTLATKLRDLNEKIEGIRREQQYQREIESVFRDASERVNKRVLWWSLLQMVVLIGAGAWQMRHLKVSLDTVEGRGSALNTVSCRCSSKTRSLDSENACWMREGVRVYCRHIRSCLPRVVSVPPLAIDQGGSGDVRWPG